MPKRNIRPLDTAIGIDIGLGSVGFTIWSEPNNSNPPTIDKNQPSTLFSRFVIFSGNAMSTPYQNVVRDEY
jgi:hypothetical protein